jgi:hypothetical protein
VVDERLESPFGRMIIFRDVETGADPASVVYLDLFLEERFYGRGYSLGSWSLRWIDTDEPLEAGELHTIELAMDREAWNRIEELTPTSDEQFPIYNAQVSSVEFFGEENAALELELSFAQPDPNSRIYRGIFYDERTGEYNFLLEEFGSPDPVSIIIAVGFLIGMTGLLSWVHQRDCLEQAREACAQTGVARANAIGSCTTETHPDGTTRTRFEAGCNWECK